GVQRCDAVQHTHHLSTRASCRSAPGTGRQRRAAGYWHPLPVEAIPAQVVRSGYRAECAGADQEGVSESHLRLTRQTRYVDTATSHQPLLLKRFAYKSHIFVKQELEMSDTDNTTELN